MFSVDEMFQGSTGVKFGDVAGIDEAVEELQEVITFFLWVFTCKNS